MRELRVQGVSVKFGQLQALADVSVSVRSGEVVMLAGPNGSGKSTLLRVLLGLVRQDRGALLSDGQQCAVDNDFKSQLGYLPEAVAFSENLTGQQVLAFFARARGVPKARVGEVLERVVLNHAARRTVRGYSRGMRQRLGLAISILSRPNLLVLDEPTGGLDQEGIKVLWSLLSEWQKAGKMVLVATHDLGLMEHRVDRMCLLRAGTVRADDTPARLRETAALPAHLTLRLHRDSGNVQLFVNELTRLGIGSGLELSGDLLTLDVPPERLIGVLSACREAAEVVQNFRVVEPGMDLVYEHMLSSDG